MRLGCKRSTSRIDPTQTNPFNKYDQSDITGNAPYDTPWTTHSWDTSRDGLHTKPIQPKIINNEKVGDTGAKCRAEAIPVSMCMKKIRAPTFLL